jgi:hypothetical protein
MQSDIEHKRTIRASIKSSELGPGSSGISETRLADVTPKPKERQRSLGYWSYECRSLDAKLLRGVEPRADVQRLRMRHPRYDTKSGGLPLPLAEGRTTRNGVCHDTKSGGLPLPLAEGQTTRNGVCQIDFTRADATPGSPLRNVDNAVSPIGPNANAPSGRQRLPHSDLGNGPMINGASPRLPDSPP